MNARIMNAKQYFWNSFEIGKVVDVIELTRKAIRDGFEIATLSSMVQEARQAGCLKQVSIGNLLCLSKPSID